MEDQCEYIFSSAGQLIRQMQQTFQPNQLNQITQNNQNLSTQMAIVTLLILFVLMTLYSNNKKKQIQNKDKFQQRDHYDFDRDSSQST